MIKKFMMFVLPLVIFIGCSNKPNYRYLSLSEIKTEPLNINKKPFVTINGVDSLSIDSISGFFKTTDGKCHVIFKYKVYQFDKDGSYSTYYNSSVCDVLKRYSVQINTRVKVKNN